MHTLYSKGAADPSLEVQSSLYARYNSTENDGSEYWDTSTKGNYWVEKEGNIGNTDFFLS